ncbi:hypothetical protein BC829DRAFT_171249 [Chytridium lagenaria]|nr:hypothetical protein BC829DRAFT_171249 [Chytridium lagenaria]
MIDRSEIHCNAWVETPVFFISRHEAVNPFQAHQDFLNTFIVYASLGEDVRNYQPVFLDSRIADGSMVAAWSHLFSSSKRLLDIRQIVDVASSYVPSGSASQNICFRKAIWGIHGALSSLSKGNRVHGACQISPLLFAFRNFMLDRLKEALNVTELVSPIKYEERKDNSTLGRFAPMWKKKLLGESTTVTITYALRGEGSRLDPHGFLFNTSKNGLADLYGTNFDDEEEEEPSDLIRRDHVHRKLKGEASLVDHLRQKITSWTTWNVQYIFNAVDFATLSFEEQVAMAQNTDVLVAPHGAVFVHLLYLRDEACCRSRRDQNAFKEDVE